MSVHSILQTSKLPNYLMLWKHLQQNGKWSSPSWRHSQGSVHFSCLWLPPCGGHALKILKWWWWGLKDEWWWCFISYLKCVKYVGFGGVILHCSKAAYSKLPQVQVKTERAVLDKFCCVKITPLNFRPLVRSQNF